MRRACWIALPLLAAIGEAILISTPLLRYAELRVLWRANPELHDPAAAVAAVNLAIREMAVS